MGLLRQYFSLYFITVKHMFDWYSSMPLITSFQFLIGKELSTVLKSKDMTNLQISSLQVYLLGLLTVPILYQTVPERVQA